jgi:uncharacterized protein with HEPN domain
MSRDLASIRDMLNAARLVQEGVKGFDKEGLARDWIHLSAVVRQIEIIGEATRRLTKEFRSDHPEIPWKDIAGMRGDIAFYSGRYAEAETIYRELVNRVGTPQQYVRLAMVRNHLGSPGEAAAFLEAAEKRYHGVSAPMKAWLKLQRGLIAFGRGRTDEALALYRFAADELPGWWLIDEHIAESGRGGVGADHHLYQILLILRQGYVPLVRQFLARFSSALAYQLLALAYHAVGKRFGLQDFAVGGHIDTRSYASGNFFDRCAGGRREDFDSRRGGNLLWERFVQLGGRRFGGKLKSSLQTTGRQQSLHDVRPFELFEKLVGAIEVGQTLQAAIHLPAEQPVTVEGRVVIARGRPKGPFAVGAHEQCGQRLPSGENLEGGPVFSTSDRGENDLRSPRHVAQGGKHFCRIIDRFINDGLSIAIGGPANAGKSRQGIAEPA